MSTSPAHRARRTPTASPTSSKSRRDTVKPHLRGWIHLGVTPLVVVASIVLVVLSPTRGQVVLRRLRADRDHALRHQRAYHRGHWSPTTSAVLRRLDHTNIFLIIAGTYTPLSILLLPAATARVLLIVVWAGALVGLLARVLARRTALVDVPVYVALGWVAVWFFPSFYRSGGPWIVFWIALGGLAYTSARSSTAPSGPTRARAGSGSTRCSTR